MDGLLDKRLIDVGIGKETYSAVPTGQSTLKQPIGCCGIGLHTGQRVSLRLLPAPADTGIVFRRSDLGVELPARFNLVSETKLCTLIAQNGVQVGTIEHLMAAFAALEIDNAIVELDGPEVPVLDGSSDGFVFLLECAGRAEQGATRQVIEILRTVRVQEGLAFAELHPADGAGLDISLSIDFTAAVIGRQALSLRLSPQTFRQELMRARTFTHADEVAALQQSGLALGGSLENAVVVDGAQILNPEGLRMPDEFVRHKMLDMIGDLALAGAPIYGRVFAHRTGHTLNNRLLRTLFADPAAWRYVAVEAAPAWLSAA